MRRKSQIISDGSPRYRSKLTVRPARKALHSGSDLEKYGMTMCKEKGRLTLEYQEGTAKFSQTVTDLRQKMGTPSQEEYERLKRITEERRVHSEEARLALERHVVAHNC
jgi:hypothetical protein